MPLPALAPLIPVIQHILPWILGMMAVKGGADIASKGYGQYKEGQLGQSNIDLLKKQLEAQSKGGKMVYESTREDTAKFLERLTQERSSDRAERRYERADILKAQNQQQEMNLLAMLMQSMTGQAQEGVDRRQFREPPPPSITNFIRGM